MATLTRLMALTQLVHRAAGAAPTGEDPLAGMPLELVTEDGLFLLTEDGNYIGVPE